jgi:hypothetical protein
MQTSTDRGVVLNHRPSRMLAAVCALACALLSFCSHTSIARADGDPASDYLLATNVFYPFSSSVSPRLRTMLDTETARSARVGFPLKVALIGAPSDLGAISALFGRPQSYAGFLYTEIAYRPVLVVMPQGFGISGIRGAVTSVLGELPSPSSTSGDALARSAIVAVASLARAAGHPLRGFTAPDLRVSARPEPTAERRGLVPLVMVLVGGALLLAAALGAAMPTGTGDGGNRSRPGRVDRRARNPGIRAHGARRPTIPSAMAWAQAYFASDTPRAIQTVLGLLWLLDGGLQFQSFMYSHGFIHSLTGTTTGQPSWLRDSMIWAAHIMQSSQIAWNTLFALIQLLIGLGLLYRRTTKTAIVLSCAWALGVWWFAEGFGMLFITMAMPLTGAPGAVILYPLIGLLVWPGGRPGGLLGAPGARTAWLCLWIVTAWLWLGAPSSSANGITAAINAAPSGMSWLSTVQDWAAHTAQGNGLPIALVLAGLSAAIGVTVAVNWRARTFLALAIVLNLAYWALGQGFGGIFQGGATDPSTGLLFVLLTWTMYTLDRHTGSPPIVRTAESISGRAPTPEPAPRRELARTG